MQQVVIGAVFLIVAVPLVWCLVFNKDGSAKRWRK